jgi:hypothetical protein
MWAVSQNPNITWDIVKWHPDKNWHYYSMLLRNNMNIKN